MRNPRMTLRRLQEEAEEELPMVAPDSAGPPKHPAATGSGNPLLDDHPPMAHESFPSLDSFKSPGEMSGPCPGGGGQLGTDDIITLSDADVAEPPIQPTEVPSIDCVIMQRWYPDDIRESSQMDETAAALKDDIARLVKSKGFKVSLTTMRALDGFVAKVVDEHRRALEPDDRVHHFDAFSNDMKSYPH